jgi:dTDP-glucose 4,6-dehydratase
MPHNAKKILITGGTGFIGHHVVEHILKKTNWEIIILDKLTYAGSLQRLTDISPWEKGKSRVKFVWHDIRAVFNDIVKYEIGEVDYILHLAAETHVDRSIVDAELFLMTNVIGTMHLLNFALGLDNLEWLVYFSTDEIFGSAPEGAFYKEWDRYNSSNPYAASKAGAEELVLAYANTYKLPSFITHTTNVFGERQHPEKFIPMTIKKILNHEVIQIHSDLTRTVSSSRIWIHARSVAESILFLLNYAEQREKYNIIGNKEISNLGIATLISDVIGNPLHVEMIDFHSARPGHDMRYSLDGSRLRGMGFVPSKSLEASLIKTVKWTLDHKQWLLGS